MLKLIKVDSKPAFIHKSAYERVFLRRERKRVELLLFFIEGIYFMLQVVGREVVKAVRGVGVAKHDDQRPVEVGGAVDFQ